MREDGVASRRGEEIGREGGERVKQGRKGDTVKER